jgi:hypothetical protein
MPRHLQSEIHSDFSSESGVWASYKTLVIGLYNSSQDPLKTDFDNHLIREYNRKIHDLGQNSGLFITPFDAGYRFIGTSVSSSFSYKRPDGISDYNRPDGISTYIQP